MRTLVTVLFAVMVTFAGKAGAQQCDVFTDVLATDSFCPAVQWLKNRAITTGCAAGMYCPANNVTRAQMALFMNRLGNALSPEILGQSGNPGSVTVQSTAPYGVYCVTSDSTVSVHPRVVVLNSTFAGLADATIAWAAAAVYSTDAGTTWNQIFNLPRASAASGEWSAVPDNGTMLLSPGLAYRFGILVARDDIVSGTTGNFTASRCELVAAINNQNGVAPPY